MTEYFRFLHLTKQQVRATVKRKEAQKLSVNDNRSAEHSAHNGGNLVFLTLTSLQRWVFLP